MLSVLLTGVFPLLISGFLGPVYSFDKSTSSCISTNALLPDPYESERWAFFFFFFCHCLCFFALIYLGPNFANLFFLFKMKKKNMCEAL